MTDSPPLPQEPCPECEYLGEARVRIAALEAELGNAAAILEAVAAGSFETNGPCRRAAERARAAIAGGEKQ